MTASLLTQLVSVCFWVLQEGFMGEVLITRPYIVLQRSNLVCAESPAFWVSSSSPAGLF